MLIYTCTLRGDACIEVMRRLGLAWYPSPERAARAVQRVLKGWVTDHVNAVATDHR